MTPAMTPMTNSITRAVINTRVAPHLRSRYCRLRLSSSISSILSSAAALLIRDMVSTGSQQLSPNILILPRHTVNERKNALALWAQESKVIWFAELLREIHNQRSFYCPSDFEINLKQEVSVNQLRGSYLHWDQMQIVNKILFKANLKKTRLPFSPAEDSFEKQNGREAAKTEEKMINVV